MLLPLTPVFAAPGVFAAAGDAVAFTGEGGGDDADVTAAAAGVSVFFVAGGGDIAAALGAVFLEQAGGAGAVSCVPLRCDYHGR